MRSLNLRNRIGSRAIGPKPVVYLQDGRELIGPTRGPLNPKRDRLRLAALQPNTLPNSRLGSVRDGKPCPQRRQLSTEAVAGCGDGCTANHCQPGLLLTAELDQIADAGVGDPGFCNGPRRGKYAP
jgi:hypothetical protein